jgi:hypothetical protein
VKRLLASLDKTRVAESGTLSMLKKPTMAKAGPIWLALA